MDPIEYLYQTQPTVVFAQLMFPDTPETYLGNPSGIITESPQPFTWDSGLNVATGYGIDIGTTNYGSGEIHSFSLGDTFTLDLQLLAQTIPPNEDEVFVRLFTDNLSIFRDYHFVVNPSPATMQTPVDGATV